jgi:serine/threonine protein kinase
MGDPVNESEREMTRLLVDRLPEPYWVVPNLTLSQNGHPHEYDAIVVAPHAVHVVEIKAWSGDVEAVSSGKWQLSNGRFVPNPLDRTTHKAKILASKTNELHLQSPNGEMLKNPYVQACLLCSGADVAYDVDDDARDQCLTPADATRYLTDPDAIKVGNIDRDRYRHCTREIAEHVAGRLEARDPEPPRYGNYRATEPIETRDDVKTYRARHAELDDGRLYRIRAWFLSQYRLDEDERRQRLAELRRSAEALASIGRHEHLATLRDFGQSESTFYEVVEWSERGTLGTAIQRGHTSDMAVARRLDLLAGIARGLEAASDAGVTHRSLTPESILLAPGGSPEILDFDLARMPDDSETIYGDAAGDMVQSEYVAPELSSSRDYEVHPSSDLYSLGVIAAELFVGQPPGMAGGWERVRPRLVDALPETLAEPVVETIESLRADDPEARPDDAGGVAAQFEQWVEQIESKTDTPVTSAGLRDERRDPTDLGPGELIDDGTRIRDVLHHGPTSVVFEVDNDVLGDTFALKLATRDEAADPDAPLRAFRHLRDLDHPGLVSVHWAGRLGDGNDAPGYLLMDRLDGETLETHLAREGALPVERAIEWTVDLLEALDVLHPVEDDDGWLHRDIKPDNVVLDDRPVLIDFDSAIAHSIEADGDDTSDAPVGTLQYTPPDLEAGGWDRSCDLFAVGCLLWEMLAGRSPWEETAPSDDRPPPRLDELRSDVPASLADVVERALAPARADRFQRAATLADALESHAERAEPHLSPDVDLEQLVDEARASIWTGDLLERLAEADDLRVACAELLLDDVYAPHASADGPAADGFLEAAARATGLEGPLPATCFELYDRLVAPAPPRPLDGSADPGVLELSSHDLLVVADGLHWFEAARLADGADVDWWTWTAGPTDPRPGRHAGQMEDETLSAPLETAFDLPESTQRLDATAGGGNLVDDGTFEAHEGPIRLELDLPVGRRGGASLARLLDRRWRRLRETVERVSEFDRTVWVTSRYGTIHLGRGLCDDVGDEEARRAWADAFPEGRIGTPDGELPTGDRVRPWRDTAGRRFPVGRIAWPDPNAPMLQRGGASLPESLLPLMRIEEGSVRRW